MEDQMKKHAGHGIKNTRIEHHDDGSHTVHHEFEDGKSRSHALGDLDNLHDCLEDCLGIANDGEDADENGNPYEGA